MKTAFKCFGLNQQWSPHVVPKSDNVMSTRHSLTLLASVGLFFGVYATGNAHATDSPNIVFIMADDLGTGHLGFNGQTKIRTPNIDHLRAEGLYFSQVYAGCAVCAPCRSVLMTGYHMGHTSVRGNSGGIPLLDEDVTVAEVIKKAGYATGCFGKWGVGDAHSAGAWRPGKDSAPSSDTTTKFTPTPTIRPISGTTIVSTTCLATQAARLTD